MSTLVEMPTFEELLGKLREETDLMEEDPEEQFIRMEEFIGHYNDAIAAMEGRIMGIDEDYFLAKDKAPIVEDENEIDFPENIYLNKLRAMIARDGDGRVYEVERYRRNKEFLKIMDDEENLSGDEDYQWYPLNNAPGEQKMVLVPAARNTAVIAPMPSPTNYITRFYIRKMNRIPRLGQYTNQESILNSNVDVGANTIAVDPVYPYVTGDAVKLFTVQNYTVPTGLVAGTIYYVIALSATSIKLATSRVLAIAGTAIDITAQGTGFFKMKVAATQAIVIATIVDAPEFSGYLNEWVKANCIFKEGDPRLGDVAKKLQFWEGLMVDTLSNKVPDDNDQVEADLSHYAEHN